jgi:hypothetical protein
VWARVVEVTLGCWLAVSPFIFQYGGATALWIVNFVAAFAVVVFAVLSWWEPTRHAHLANALVASALIAYGRFAVGAEPDPAHQNFIMIGLLLLMFSIVPNWASAPPPHRVNENSE